MLSLLSNIKWPKRRIPRIASTTTIASTIILAYLMHNAFIVDQNLEILIADATLMSILVVMLLLFFITYKGSVCHK